MLRRYGSPRFQSPSGWDEAWRSHLRVHFMPTSHLASMALRAASNGGRESCSPLKSKQLERLDLATRTSGFRLQPTSQNLKNKDTRSPPHAMAC